MCTGLAELWKRRVLPGIVADEGSSKAFSYGGGTTIIRHVTTSYSGCDWGRTCELRPALLFFYMLQ